MALIGGVLAPAFAAIAWPELRWNVPRRLMLTALLVMFWSGYLNYPLSDFPALALALLALIAVSRADSPPWLLLAGPCAGLALNMRPAYIFLLPPIGGPARLGLGRAAWLKRRIGSSSSALRHRAAGRFRDCRPASGMSQHDRFGQYNPVPRDLRPGALPVHGRAPTSALRHLRRGVGQAWNTSIPIPRRWWRSLTRVSSGTLPSTRACHPASGHRGRCLPPTHRQRPRPALHHPLRRDAGRGSERSRLRLASPAADRRLRNRVLGPAADRRAGTAAGPRTGALALPGHAAPRGDPDDPLGSRDSLPAAPLPPRRDSDRQPGTVDTVGRAREATHSSSSPSPYSSLRRRRMRSASG